MHGTAPDDRIDFDIGVCAVNEAATIGACLDAIDRACVGRSARIAVLLNGSTDASEERVAALRPAHASITVFRFPYADKANALNHFLHTLRKPAGLYVLVDAYALVGNGALRALAAALEAQPEAIIASGVPASGRTAAAVASATMRGGVTNGQLFAMRPAFVERFAAAGLRLPVQLYRVDGLLGSMAAHALDAVGTPWSDSRIVGVAEATFSIRPLSPFRIRDIKRQFNREIRQARGAMETAAIKAVIYAGGFAALPADANDMLRQWLAANRPLPRTWREAVFSRLALRRLAATRPMPPSIPAEVFQVPASQPSEGGASPGLDGRAAGFC